MSIGSLTIITSLLQNKKYDRDDVKNCLIETSKKYKERPNDILIELIDESIKNTQFPVTLEDDDITNSFKTIDEAVNKMRAIILKDGIGKKRTFVFRFKAFFPKGKLSTYKHLGYSFNKNRFTHISVTFTSPNRYEKEYEIKYSVIRHTEMNLPDLVDNDSLKGIIHIIRQRHYTAVDQDYEQYEEGYDKELDDLAGFTSESEES